MAGRMRSNVSPSSFFVQVSINMPNSDTAASIGMLYVLELSVYAE